MEHDFVRDVDRQHRRYLLLDDAIPSQRTFKQNQTNEIFVSTWVFKTFSRLSTSHGGRLAILFFF